MSTKRYYQVSGFQLFWMVILSSIITSQVISINTSIRDYLELPVVVMTKDGKCASVNNYRNGDAYTCNDVGVVLRKYRKKIE